MQSSTDLCSVAAVTRCLPFRLRAWAAPLIARLLDSVDPDVKMRSLDSAPIAPATCPRARSTASAASQPNRCEMLAALPYTSEKYGSITWRTRGSVRVVA